MKFDELIQKYLTDSSIQLCVSSFESPLGVLVGIADDDNLLLLSFEDSKNIANKLQALQEELKCSFVENKKNKVLHSLKLELAAYFYGELKKFTVPLKIRGSEFQKVIDILYYFSISCFHEKRSKSGCLCL